MRNPDLTRQIDKHLKLKVRKSCRACGLKALTEILSLRKLAVSNFVEGEGSAVYAPLSLAICDPEKGGCGLVQLKHVSIPPDELYRQYWYKSGMNESMRVALKDVAEKIEALVKLSPGDIICDIGANDGTLLRSFENRKIIKMGFEPAINLIPECKEGTDYVINNFFNYADFIQTLGNNKKAKVITSIAMFYDLEDPNVFVSELSQCLDIDGIWVNQLSYLPLMLKQNAFDNICHEHIEYYSLSSMVKLLDKHSLEVFDVELNDVNGGSFRVYIKHKYNLGIQGFPGAKERIRKLLSSERKMQIDKKVAYEEFAKRVKSLKYRITNFIKYTAKYNKSVYIYGASTKGNTFLQYMGLDHKSIKGAAERNPAKWGKKTVATNIPIVSEVTARADNPDYFLVLPWHFKEEFLKREIEYLKNGGKMIFPLPHFEIIEYRNKKLISSGDFQTPKVKASASPLVSD